MWLNPPYAHKLILAFTDKLIAELSAGHTQAAIMLTNASKDTQWFKCAHAKCTALCFSRRIAFWKPDDSVGRAPAKGSAFFYFGEQAAASALRIGIAAAINCALGNSRAQ